MGKESRKAGEPSEQAPAYIRARRMLHQLEALQDYGWFPPNHVSTIRKIAEFGHVPEEQAKQAWTEMRTALYRARVKRRNARDGSGRAGHIPIPESVSDKTLA